jgi:diacylglycerol kinase (ATP)
MRTCVVINPVAGSVGDISLIAAALGRLPGVRVMLTTSKEDAELLAREVLGEGFDRFVAAGGDGTVNGVLNGIGGALDRVEMGILPLGTGNDFAASIGMRIEIADALEALVRWEVHPVDVVRVRAVSAAGAAERLMLNGSAGGFVEAVGAATGQSVKRGILGPLSYVFTAAASLSEMQAYDLTLLVGDREHQLRAVSTVVTSGRTLGGAVPVNPEGRIDDGIIELMVIPPMSLADLALLGVSILGGTHTTNPELRFFSGPRIALIATPGMPVNADGEEVGDTPVDYEVLPRALRMVIGPSPAGVRGPELSGAGARNAR